MNWHLNCQAKIWIMLISLDFRALSPVKNDKNVKILFPKSPFSVRPHLAAFYVEWLTTTCKFDYVRSHPEMSWACSVDLRYERKTTEFSNYTLPIQYRAAVSIRVLRYLRALYTKQFFQKNLLLVQTKQVKLLAVAQPIVMTTKQTKPLRKFKFISL